MIISLAESRWLLLLTPHRWGLQCGSIQEHCLTQRPLPFDGQVEPSGLFPVSFGTDYGA